MKIYLDNSASSRPYDEVIDAVSESMKNLYANSSSLHLAGKNAEDGIEKARKTISSYLKCSADELYFTSGGTESNNIAIFGSARANKRSGMKIITSKVEHPAVLECFKSLCDEGFETVYINVDENGIVDVNELEREVDKNTILVSIMSVNNETGAIMPLEKIGRIIKEKNPDCLFHTDCVQGFGKVDIDVDKMKLDMLSVSAHKIHGPKGVGALYIRKKTKIKSPVCGGGHEKGMRSGTLNTSGILGFAKACEIIFSKDKERLSSLKKYFIDEVLKIGDVTLNTPEMSVPNVFNLSFEGVRSEVLLHVLESKGIFVSSGSACSSHKKEDGYVLDAMGRNAKQKDSAIRFSPDEDITKEEIDYVISVLKKEVPVLRKIMR